MTTYIVLNKPESEIAVESKLESLIRKNNVGKNFNITLQPLKDVHLKSSDILFDEANANKSDISYIHSLFAVAVFIIVIAAFNFMNLSTARATNRAKEVGLRKVVGAVKSQLIFQYLGESVLLCFISLFFALALVEIFAPFAGIKMSPLNYFAENALFIFALLSGTILLGLLAGTYPAFVLSKFHPAKVLKEQKKFQKRNLASKSFSCYSVFNFNRDDNWDLYCISTDRLYKK